MMLSGHLLFSYAILVKQAFDTLALYVVTVNHGKLSLRHVEYVVNFEKTFSSPSDSKSSPRFV